MVINLALFLKKASDFFTFHITFRYSTQKYLKEFSYFVKALAIFGFS